MEFTINCTRVSLPQATTLYGTPVKVSLAILGPVSDHNASSGEFNDGTALNLSRRVVSERKEPGTTTTKHLVNCKNTTIISSLNTRTLGPLGRLEEFSKSAKSQGIDIIAVQEHRFIILMTHLNTIVQIPINS